MFRPGSVVRYCLTGGALLLGVWLLLPHGGGTAVASAISNTYLPVVYRQSTPTPSPTPPVGWYVEYYANANLSGSPFAARWEDYEHPEVDWGKGAPLAGMPSDSFSVRFSGDRTFAAGNYAFYVSADDGCRLYIDGQRVLDEWHASPLGTATYRWAGPLSAGKHQLIVEYYDESSDAMVRLLWFDTGLFPEWRAEYYNNDALDGDPALVRNDGNLDFHHWGTGSPAPGIDATDFSVRWTRAFYVNEGQYVLLEENRGGAKVWVNSWADDRELIDDWSIGSRATRTGFFNARTTGWYMITVTYRKHTGEGRMRFKYIYGGAKEFFVGEYYNDTDLDDLYGVQYHETIDFHWGDGRPMSGMSRDNFSVRWLKIVDLDGGTYRFTADFDDGARVWVDDQLAIDIWEQGGAHYGETDERSYSDGWHAIIMEYYDAEGDAFAVLQWQQTSSYQASEADSESGTEYQPGLPVLP